MKLDDYFYKLEVDCNILDKVFDFLPTATWGWVPFMNLATNFSPRLLHEDNFMKNLPKKFYPVLRLYKFTGNGIYNWHRDAEIGCSFNMVLDDYRSFTLFNTANKSDLTHDILELKYEKHKWYLFNSQILHSVINLDHRDRFLLTVTFPKIVKYHQVLEFIKQS